MTSRTQTGPFGLRRVRGLGLLQASTTIIVVLQRDWVPCARALFVVDTAGRTRITVSAIGVGGCRCVGATSFFGSCHVGVACSMRRRTKFLFPLEAFDGSALLVIELLHDCDDQPRPPTPSRRLTRWMLGNCLACVCAWISRVW